MKTSLRLKQKIEEMQQQSLQHAIDFIRSYHQDIHLYYQEEMADMARQAIDDQEYILAIHILEAIKNEAECYQFDPSMGTLGSIQCVYSYDDLLTWLDEACEDLEDYYAVQE